MDHNRPAPQRRDGRRFTDRQRRTLALGGLAAAAGVTLSGCDSQPNFQNAQFTTVSECTRAGFDDQLCQSSYAAALQQYQKDAPKFNTLSQCEQEWGSSQCAPAASTGASSGNVFVPLLAGFVISQALQQRYYRDGPSALYYGGSYGGGYATPIYRDRRGATVVVDRSGGRAIAKPVNVNTMTVSRSGFGGMGKSRSGFSFGG